MKKNLFLCLTAVLILSSGNLLLTKKTNKLAETIIAIDKIVPGMSSDEFRKNFPGIIPNENYYNGSAFEKMNFEGIDGYWKYDFSKNILDYASFENYSIINYSDYREKRNELKAELDIFYTGSHAILKKLTTLYGLPKIHTVNDSTGLKLDGNDYSLTFVSASWEINELIINLTASYSGRSQPSAAQVNINNAEMSPDAFRLNLTFSGKEEIQQLHFRMGETAQEIEKRNPAVFKNGTGLFGNYSVNSSIGTLYGTWSFCFKNNALQNAGFDYYYHENRYEKDDLTEKKYHEIVKKCRSVKDELEKALGKASSGYDSIPSYKTISSKGISGNDYMAYEWKTKTKLIRLNFDHHYGGKGISEHSLSLDVRITDAEGNYSYCDR